MVSVENGKSEVTPKTELNIEIPLNVSASQRKLISPLSFQRRWKSVLPSFQDLSGFLKFGRPTISLQSPSAKFRHIAEDRDEFSRKIFISSYHDIRKRINQSFVGKLEWASLRRICKEWIRNPMNMALFVWIVCVAVSGAMLFLVMTGMLNNVLRKKSQRDVWFEINNQILNGLFTLMCLYQHPKRCYHLVLLCRWDDQDIVKLRKVYCKDGTYKPHEWAHMVVVVLLLQLNCFSQYALCGLNLGYSRSERPALGVGICISFAIAAPAIAGIYSILSPLGRDYITTSDEEAQIEIDVAHATPIHAKWKLLERRLSFASSGESGVIESHPEWKGGVLDFWEDIYLAYLSLFCSFCVFGWNMERLGFGNMYVHITTFILFCMAPFWVFNLAAVNIDNELAREVLAVTGIVLCLFGLFYGGFWRIQMRKRFNLPENTYCCGNPSATDCMLWLFCCWCSLAQEVRTGNAYEIVDEKFCEVDSGVVSMPLPRPDGAQTLSSGPSSPVGLGLSPIRSQDLSIEVHEDGDCEKPLAPPITSLMQK